MALAKFQLEIEVEDTFQNGSKLDLTAMYNLINQIAENEYNRQFDANMLQRRFGMKMAVNDEPFVTEPELELEDEVEGETSEVQALRRRRKRRGLALDRIEANLFLPGQSQNRGR